MIGEGGLIVDRFPTAPDQTVALVALAQKSYMTIQLQALGQGGHSSMPPNDNALARLARAVSELHENRFEPQLRSPVSEMLAALAPHVGGFRGFLMQNQWLSRWILAWQMSLDEATRPMVTTTTAVTIMHAGVKDNVVPQQASATVNFRLLPGDTAEAVVARVEDIIDDPRVRVEVIRADTTPTVADPDGEGFSVVRDAIAASLPEAIVIPGLVVATTDTRHYQSLVDNVYHFHPMRLPMEDAQGVHGTDERIALENIDLAVAIYRRLLEGAGRP
jgi:carboxypeptidase PM20D1